MAERRSLLEDLPIELFYLIFKYLAPHDLLFTFENLNRRFTSMLKQQPLCLPNNRHMNFDLYLEYIDSIIPDHASQIVYLNLSERRAPHAVDWFICQVPLDELTWPSLKAVTIEDVPRHTLEALLNDLSLLSNVHSLSIDIDCKRYHYLEYKNFIDSGIIIPILNTLPELRSLHLRMHTRTHNNYKLKLNEDNLSLYVYQNLHTLTIIECSRELLVELLNNGHLPKLCRLRVAFTCKSHDEYEIDPPYSTPLKQCSVSELRYISVNQFTGVAWLLSYLEEVQRSGQLERLKISGHVRFTLNSSFPRATVLRQWLLLNKSKLFQFQMKMAADSTRGGEDVQENIFAEYRLVTGDDSAAKYSDIHIRYPEMSFSYPIEMNDTDSEDEHSNNTTRSSDFSQDEQVDENIEEMEIIDMVYMKDELREKIESVPRWHRLQKINLEGDYPDDDSDIVGDNIFHLIHIGQRSPNFRELYIDADLNYGQTISLNVELGILLITQLEKLYFTAKDSNCSLGDLVEIVDRLFAHSSSLLPVLKELTLNVDGHPKKWLSVKHLVDQIEKIFHRFPKLIHFTLYCQQISAFNNRKYSLSRLAPEWYVRSSLARSNSISFIYRHKPNSLDIWL